MEKRKLGDLGSVAMNKRIYKEQTSDEGEIPFYKIGSFGKQADAFISRKLFNEYKKLYPFPKKGDILISASGSIGRTIVYNGEDAYFQDSNIIWIQHDNRLDNTFLHQLFNIIRWSGVEGTTIKRLYNKNILSTQILLPSVEEQRSIGNLLDNVDNLIAATQDKIDALEQVKKALLQRLFDQSWRFDGYLETWKKYRLGDHVKILTGGTPKTSVAEYWEPKSIPWMSSGEVNKVYLDQTDTMISLEGFKNSSARWVKKHSILIALAGQGKTRGTVAVNNIALTTNQSIAAIIPGKDLYYEYVFQNLTSRYNELRLLSSGDGTRGGLNKQIVSDVTIHSPNLNEQIQIGKLLSKVDHLSTENQLKLSRIELIKKYLLQKLFI
ncbi:restriction endonuclease subunit S [Lacticaseibacillus paracasei]|uniref:restriction endonuclease subunit S n=1 Tax=Lacticaseibacillus paracasei TaxID=1597 RepID=UPI001CDADA4B|nr:restriction endonuclease subunit S [Lacticaseibacillus paracasei]